jgi:hypothetical protein
MTMKEEEEKSRGFKVQDRRRFSAEGEARPDAEEVKPDPSAAAAERAAAAAERRAAEAELRAAAAEERAAAAAHAARAPHAPGGRRETAGAEPEITFATFIVGLSTEALAALGEMPHPATGEHKRDLRAAQQLIDILGILREKTRGNLDRDEDSLFEAILYDLRMKYVELARQS